MDEIRNTVIEDIGISYARFGNSQLLGRVVGLLLCEDEALSIDEICEILHVTKTPVNQICKRLEDLKLIKRVWIKGERKHHFRISSNVFLAAANNVIHLYEENLATIEKDLDSLIEQYQNSKGDEKKHLKAVCQRFVNMHEFHLKLIQAYNNFIEEWKEDSEKMPTVEEYIKQRD